MSKVRIYELAKEAGLKSKELADKLIKLGYPIKGHSSTVDEDMAAEIRRKVFGKKKTLEVTDQRIKVRKKSGADKPVTTVVRRRSKADKEKIARKAEEEELAEEMSEDETAVDEASAVAADVEADDEESLTAEHDQEHPAPESFQYTVEDE